MNFLFSHDGRTFAKHTECSDGEVTQVLFDETTPEREEQQARETSGEIE